MSYGVLEENINTGLNSELSYVFAAPLSVVSNQPVFVSDTLSLKRKVNSQDVQRWEIEATISPTNDSSNFLVHSVLNGHSEVFYLRMPQVYVPESKRISNSLTLSLNGTALIGVSTVNIAGLNGKILPKGEFITFAGDSKVYLVTRTSSDGTGINIYPPLRQNIASGASIKYGDKVTMLARYDVDVQLGITYIDGILTDQGSVKFIEAI